MLKSNLKLACRNLMKHKFYTFINIFGLAIATAAFLLIIHYVRFEYSYENAYRNSENILRITLDRYKGQEYVVTDCETHPPLAPLLKKEFPEVVDVVRIQRMGSLPEMAYRDKIFRIANIYAADPSVFSVFNYDFLEGTPKDALNNPFGAVLTETLAKRIFGSIHVKGQTLKSRGLLFTVTGVIKDVPPNTHLKFSMLISFATLPAAGYDINSWQGNNNFTFAQVLPGSSLAAFNRKLEKLSRERLKESVYKAEPLKDIHLYSHKSFEPEENGDIKTVRFLLFTAILILLVGSINYVNLTTARSAERGKEVGMRKALGSSRGLLIKQFMTETLLINAVAMAWALGLVWLAMPFYPDLTGRPVTANIFASGIFWFSCILLFLFNTLLSGGYPALILSDIKAASITKRYNTGGNGGILFRKTLVITQFVAALVISSASLIAYQQLHFLINQHLGLNTSEVLVIQGSPDDSIQKRSAALLRQELLQLPGVEKLAISGSIPGNGLRELNTTTGINRYGSNTGQGYNFYLYSIDAGFLPAMEIKLLAGQNFREHSPNKNEVVINKEAARLLGFSTPEAAVGEKLNVYNEAYTITGVTDNYHQQSMKEVLLPMIHWYNESGTYYSLKLKNADIQQTIAQIRQIWERQFPGYPFEYHFMNELYDQQYKADRQFVSIVEIFSGFTLFITCLGILGLTAFNVSRRTKEIGIRKVLGAPVISIVNLFTKDFTFLILIAIAIATPLSWYIMNQWLKNFAYHISIRWWMFGVAGIITLIIAFLTAGIQSVKAALSNPVKSLKME